MRSPFSSYICKYLKAKLFTKKKFNTFCSISPKKKRKEMVVSTSISLVQTLFTEVKGQLSSLSYVLRSTNKQETKKKIRDRQRERERAYVSASCCFSLLPKVSSTPLAVLFINFVVFLSCFLHHGCTRDVQWRAEVSACSRH